MRIFSVICCVCPLFLSGAEIWKGIVDAADAARTYADYTNNVVRVVWAGESNVSGADYASCPPFLFPVAGPEEDVAKVEPILTEVMKGLPAVSQMGMPRTQVLQWMVRWTRPCVTNDAAYLSRAAHPVVFRLEDFNLSRLKAFAAHLPPKGPYFPRVSVCPVYEEYTRLPIRRAQPGVDYPGLLPEETYAYPEGYALVRRAPECRRQFRFRAMCGMSDIPVEYKWVVLWANGGGGRVVNFTGGGDKLTAERGFGQFAIDRQSPCRVDLLVFARWPGGLWGPPAVISIDRSREDQRTLSANGDLLQISYPRWTDTYTLDAKGMISGFSRLRKGGVFSDDYANAGAKLLETYASGAPRKVQKVVYTIVDGVLDYTECAGEISLPNMPPRPQDRGEFTPYNPKNATDTHEWRGY